MLTRIYGPLTLWHVLGTVNFEAERGPSHCDTGWHQKIAFYVVLLRTYLSPLSLDADRRREFVMVFFNADLFSESMCLLERNLMVVR